MTWESLATGVTVLVVLVTSGYVYAKYKLSYWKRRGVKTPPANILFGHVQDLVFLRSGPAALFRRIYNSAEADEKVVGMYVFHKPLLLIRDIEIVKQIFVKELESFPRRNFGGNRERDAFGFRNLLAIHKSGWKELRNTLSPSLTLQKLRKMFPLVQECNFNLTRFIDSQFPEGKTEVELDAKEIASKYATDSAASYGFGITTNSFDEKNGETFWQRGKELWASPQGCMMIFLNFVVPEVMHISDMFLRRTSTFFRKVFWDSVEGHKSLKEPRGDFVEFLMAIRDAKEPRSYEFAHDDFVAQAASYFIGALEGVYTAITLTMFELARNPEIQDQVYREIQSVVEKEGSINFDALNHMKLLVASAEEAMRLYPPIPVLDRVAAKKYKIPGTDVEVDKDVAIYVSLDGIGRDPRYYDKPNEFIPQRTENYGFSIPIAFGAGPRTCIGQKIAEIFTTAPLAAILLQYEMTTKQQKDRAMASGSFFTLPDDDVIITFKKRQ